MCSTRRTPRRPRLAYSLPGVAAVVVAVAGAAEVAVAAAVVVVAAAAVAALRGEPAAFAKADHSSITLTTRFLAGSDNVDPANPCDLRLTNLRLM